MSAHPLDKEDIELNLQSFLSGDLKQNALSLLATLGYASGKSFELRPATVEGFNTLLRLNGQPLPRPDKAHLEEWQNVHFLFQLTDAEINRTQSLFDSDKADFTDKRIQSYLFFAVKLRNDSYRRSLLVEITREINRIFHMPVMLLFQHGATLTLSVIDRRINLREEDRDVLKKVTLIKDIRMENPHRAHLEILFDLSLEQIAKTYHVRNFVELHEAWRNVLSISHLNKAFYKEVVTWFDSAIEEIKLPSLKPKSEKHKEFAIKLISRLIFVWFLKELKVVSEDLLLPSSQLITPQAQGSDYYKFVLQNLFFNALNKSREERAEVIDDFDEFKSSFNDPDQIKSLILECPFLNGGLFDEGDEAALVARQGVNNAFKVPNEILTGKNGLNSILSHYKFTVVENTPLEEEIAVEPDMLGRIFENLLAEQTEDTREAARKYAGAFYTPRPIVSYMCRNVLLRHLNIDIKPENGKEIVRRLLDTTVIDPACGSGAFLMGMLEEMMHVLDIADHNGKIWFGEMMKSKDADFREYVSDFIADDQIRFVQKLGLLRGCLFGTDLLNYAVEITKLRCWLSLIIEQKVKLNRQVDNYNLKPLPNLEFKFYKKNSLLRKFKDRDIKPLLTAFDKSGLLNELVDLENNFFIAPSDKYGTKEEIKKKIISLLEGIVDEQLKPVESAMKKDLAHLNRVKGDGENAATINRAERAYKKSRVRYAELSKFKEEVKDYLIEPIVFPSIFNHKKGRQGFDIVIGNPPYVNTKLISQMGLSDTLKEEYGYCDDLYNHFTFRGLELAKEGGFLCYITSDTFLTIQTKENMRRMFLGLKPKREKTDGDSQANLFGDPAAHVPPRQPDLTGSAATVQAGFGFKSETPESSSSVTFDDGANCHLIEIVNTPKAFAAMVDTAIFTVRKQKPTDADNLTYIDIRFPTANTFGLTEDEWLALKEGTDNYASWEKVLDRLMFEIQIPAGRGDQHQPRWAVSHTCDGVNVLRDASTRIEKYQLPLRVYHQSLNFALFAPNEWNCRVFDKVIKPAFPVYETWWGKVETSKKIEDNRSQIQSYVRDLRAEDITLLGLITDGGQGLATGDNGKFVGALEGTRVAERILETRAQKLKEAVEATPDIRDDFEVLSDCDDVWDYRNVLDSLSEQEVRDLFDSIKDAYGRRVFGKGYLYRVVNPNEVFDVDAMTEDDRRNGIDSETEVYVPYDKGDKEGNRWFLETPYRVCWSKTAVTELQTSDEARWQGYQFFFKKGFCWSDVLNPFAVYIKTRLKSETVNDVKSMSLYDQSGLGDRFLVSILNSYLAFKIIRECFNSTVSLQLNDLRKLPIKIPTRAQLETFNQKFAECFEIKRRQFDEEITEAQALQLLKPIEEEIDRLVEELYEI